MISDVSWQESGTPATLNEARASIALAAVSGGMLEIGDNLPSLEHAPERIALIENQDLIDMIRLGCASTPMDLMDYRTEDEQPTVFFLKESSRQNILTIFNWTQQAAHRTIPLARLGLPSGGRYAVFDVLEKQDLPGPTSGVLDVTVPGQSVRVLKLVDRDMPVSAPSIALDHPASGASGEILHFSAEHSSGDPIISWEWDFGDGVTAEGRQAAHAWTKPGDYEVVVTAHGLSGEQAQHQFRLHVAGYISTVFDPAKIRRLR